MAEATADEVAKNLEDAAETEEGTRATGPGSRTLALVHPRFQGVSTPTLRAWLKYWSNEQRCAAEAEEKGVDRKVECKELQEEIDARMAKRSGGGPNA